MSIRGLAHVNLRASEALVERLRRFYTDVVGLREGTRPPFRSQGYWLYAGGVDVVHLTVDPAARDDSSQPTGWLDHYAFAADDLDAVLARLVAAGVPYTLDRVPGSDQAQVFLRDPAGVGVELNFTGEPRPGASP